MQVEQRVLRLEAGKNRSFRGLLPAAQRDLPLHGRLVGAIMAPSDPESSRKASEGGFLNIIAFPRATTILPAA
jgi:hypothetical protein